MKRVVILLCGFLTQSFLYSGDNDPLVASLVQIREQKATKAAVQMDNLKKKAADKKALTAWQQQVLTQHPENFVGAVFAFESHQGEDVQLSSVMNFVAQARKKFKEAQEKQSCCSAWICCPQEAITRGKLLKDGTDAWGEETVSDRTIPLSFKGFSRGETCCGNETSKFHTGHKAFGEFLVKHTPEQLAFIQKLHKQDMDNRMKQQPKPKDSVMRRDSPNDGATKEAEARHIVLNDDDLKIYQTLESNIQLNLAANFDLVGRDGKKVNGPVLAERRSSMVAGAAKLSAAAVVAGSTAARVSVSGVSIGGDAVVATDGGNAAHIAGGASEVAPRAQSKSEAAGLAVRGGAGSVSQHPQQAHVTDSAPGAAALHDGRNRRSSTVDSEHHGEHALQVRRESMAGTPAVPATK